MPNKFVSNLAKFGDTLKDAAGNVIDKIDDKIDMPIIIDVVGIKRAGAECYTKARESSALCKTTIEKAHEMVTFGQELQTTLDDASRGDMNASTFETIRELVEGDKIHAATQLAKELSGLSLNCVETSQEMIVSMEKGIDALPDIVEPFVNHKRKLAAKKGHRKGDPKLPDVEASVSELSSLVSDVEKVRLSTVVEKGSAAFEGLRKNGELSKEMFVAMLSFAESVEAVSGSFRKTDDSDGTDDDDRSSGGNSLKTLGKIRTVAKDAWRCLRLSSLMKDFAEAVGRLIKWIIQLFQAASSKLGGIWRALAHAKDTMARCLVCVTESMTLCDTSLTKTLLLKDTTLEVHRHMSNIVTLDGGALNSFRELADGDEILLCIELGTTIDDLFTDCIRQVITSVDQVNDTIRSMPEVLREDVPELTPIEKDDEDDDDPIVFELGESTSGELARSVDGKRSITIPDTVQELDSMRSAIEKASPLTILPRSVEGFKGVGSTLGVCEELIVASQNFATDCERSIDSFANGPWDLTVATGHLLELVEVRDAGLRMKHSAQGVLELVRATLAIFKTFRTKSKGGLAGSGGTDLGSIVGSLASDVDVDDLKGLGKALGSLFR
mmetsp:Transcript_18016/g.50004  ORF Transcript_18016/g.50004 Transcript_18016/m.50004 type:complete len:611 (+) Transcript_18016:156-1988(+)